MTGIIFLMGVICVICVMFVMCAVTVVGAMFKVLSEPVIYFIAWCSGAVKVGVFFVVREGTSCGRLRLV